MDTYATLNDALVKLFRDVMDLEEQVIITEEFQDITNNDMHVIQAIGTGEPKNMSTIAKELSVTVGTLTIAMNSLVILQDLTPDETESLVKALAKLNIWFRKAKA